MWHKQSSKVLSINFFYRYQTFRIVLLYHMLVFIPLCNRTKELRNYMPREKSEPKISYKSNMVVCVD